jgi:pimeloyl-ACP methyl ester carboxylesterase
MTWIIMPMIPPPWSSIWACRAPRHVGHSTGGGVVARYITRHPEDKVAKGVLISAVPPLMVKTADNPDGIDKSVFDDFQANTKANRAQFFHDVPAGPFYGYNRDGAKAVGAGDPQLVASGHDGRRQGALRQHRRLLADRFPR